jgi:hypothetical protein
MLSSPVAKGTTDERVSLRAIACEAHQDLVSRARVNLKEMGATAEWH